MKLLSELAPGLLVIPIPIQAVCDTMYMMVDGTKFWISCNRPKLLRKASRWQLIQSSVPSTIMWRQCDIWIGAPKLSLKPPQ